MQKPIYLAKGIVRHREIHLVVFSTSSRPDTKGLVLHGEKPPLKSYQIGNKNVCTSQHTYFIYILLCSGFYCQLS